MQDAIVKADALVEAHQYIRRFRDKVIVVKVGGSIMDQPKALRSMIEDICFMAAVGMRPIIVHGGGKAITDAMNKAGLEGQFVQGRRYTDERTLSIAEHVLINQINKNLINIVRDMGHQAMGLHSLASCVVFAKRLFLQGQGEAAGRRIDIGFVGDVEGVNRELLSALVESHIIPVIAPIARDSAGGKLNVNADTVAGHVAAAVKAQKLILVSDTHGIRTGDGPQTLASHLTHAQIQKLVDDKIIAAGMVPKVEASFTALQAGVVKTHIVDGRIPHAIMLEVYTEKGVGTEIVL